MAMHIVSACADPRTEGSATFEDQLRDDLRLRHPRLRIKAFRIGGYGSLLCPNVNGPHLRQYAVRVVVDDDDT